MSSATFSSIRRVCLLRLCEATISTQRITGRPVARMMENCEQISASSLSLIFVRTGEERTLFFSSTASSLVMNAQVSRSLLAASNSS